MKEKTQREIILACLIYALHRLTKHEFTGIYKTGVRPNELLKVIKQVENYEAKFGVMTFTSEWKPCEHKGGYYYQTLFRKEMFFCPDCQNRIPGKFIRVLREKDNF